MSKKKVYIYTCGPNDYWQNWSGIHEFSNKVIEEIKKNPRITKRFQEYQDDFFNLLYEIREKGVMDLRDNRIYFCFMREIFPNECTGETEEIIQIVLGYKSDSNGTTNAFTFSVPNKSLSKDSFGLSEGDIFNDFGGDWECDNLSEEEKKELMEIFKF